MEDYEEDFENSSDDGSDMIQSFRYVMELYNNMVNMCVDFDIKIKINKEGLTDFLLACGYDEKYITFFEDFMDEKCWDFCKREIMKL